MFVIAATATDVNIETICSCYSFFLTALVPAQTLCNLLEQNTLPIEGFKYDSSLSLVVQKLIRRQPSQAGQFPRHDNNTARAFNSGISYQGIEGKNTV